MAVVTSAVVVAGATAYSAYEGRKGAKKAEEAARQQGETEAEYAARQAELIKKQAGDEVEKIRRLATEYRSQQIGAQAASGIMTNVGSAQVVQDKTSRLAEQDVLLTMENAEDGVLMKMEEGRLARMSAGAQASMYASQGRLAIAQGIAGIGSLGMQFWKK